MRRLIILLLAVVIPMKAWAGIVQPFALASGAAGIHAAIMPQAGASESQHTHHAPPMHDDCCLSADAGASGHAMECPHLSMPLLAAPAPLSGITCGWNPPPVAASASLRSIVLEVLLPPPLALL